MPVDHASVLPLSGDLSRASADELLAAVVGALAAEPTRPVVYDVSQLSASGDADELMVFPQALARVGGWPGASLSLAAPSALLRHALGAQHIDRYLPVFATVPDALGDAARQVTASVRRLSLDPDPQSPRTARQVLSDEWPHGQQGREAAAFVLHELCANAVTHVGEPFSAQWAVTAERVLVAVTDCSRQEPILRPVGPYSATSGRGIQLVKAMSRAWGVRWVYPGGKTVWSDIEPACFG